MSNSFHSLAQVYIDLEEVSTGSLDEDFDILPPKKIKDPKATKPEDWDERAKIPDPEDIKPAGWDDIPATIPDKEATKPEDWDEEEDGKGTATSVSLSSCGGNQSCIPCFIS